MLECRMVSPMGLSEVVSVTGTGAEVPVVASKGRQRRRLTRRSGRQGPHARDGDGHAGGEAAGARVPSTPSSAAPNGHFATHDRRVTRIQSNTRKKCTTRIPFAVDKLCKEAPRATGHSLHEARGTRHSRGSYSGEEGGGGAAKRSGQRGASGARLPSGEAAEGPPLLSICQKHTA
jgi:hypothetical protein